MNLSSAHSLIVYFKLYLQSLRPRHIQALPHSENLSPLNAPPTVCLIVYPVLTGITGTNSDNIYRKGQLTPFPQKAA